jgi:hypothetical protein
VAGKEGAYGQGGAGGVKPAVILLHLLSSTTTTPIAITIAISFIVGAGAVGPDGPSPPLVIQHEEGHVPGLVPSGLGLALDLRL